ncbi:HET-domain-containing protein [Trametes cingulata]|nr:HET-domain-containing protein [Trametes cingulata]
MAAPPKLCCKTPFTVKETLQACEGTIVTDAIQGRPLRVLECDRQGAFQVVPYQGQPYIAISYCWPDQTFHKLNTSNEPTSVITAGILAPSQHFSLFISRAVHSHDSTLAVWLDFHCINQSDEEEKMTQVAVMHRIYTGAKTTLVMLEDIALSPEELVVLTTSKTSSRSSALIRRILSARWFSRAWCSQELILSRRVFICMHDTSREKYYIKFPSDTFWHWVDALRTRNPSIPFFSTPRGSLPDIVFAKSTCAWALGLVHKLGCSDEYDKASLVCNLVRLTYRFASRPSAFKDLSPALYPNVLKMVNVIALQRHDYSLLLVNHGRHNPLRGFLGFGWAGQPIDGDAASLAWASKDFQVAKDPGIRLESRGLIARGCLALVTREHTWEIHRDCTGLHLTVEGYTRTLFFRTRVHASWTWTLDARHLQDVITALASVDRHGWEDASHHARIVFAYLLSEDYELQPDPIPGDLRALARTYLGETSSNLKHIATAMGFIWRYPGLAMFSTVALSDGSVLLVSGNASPDLTGRLLFQPYVVRPKLFSPPTVLTANSMVLEKRPSSRGVYRCIGCVRGLGMLSDVSGHAAQTVCVG